MQISTPSLYMRLLAGFGRLYPLLSGCGTLASCRLALALLPRTDKQVWARVGKSECLVSLDDYVGRAIFIFGDLDRKITRIIRSKVSFGDTVVDVGANLGLVTITAGEAVGPTGLILAFEPSPPTLEKLQLTKKRNAKLPIRLFEIAVGRENNITMLNVPCGNAGMATVGNNSVCRKSRAFRICIRRLGDILVEQNITKIDLMKIDVEGFEAEVIEGLFAVEGAPRPKKIIIEEHFPQKSAAFDRLRQEGYKIQGIRKTFLSIKYAEDGSSRFYKCHDFLAQCDPFQSG